MAHNPSEALMLQPSNPQQLGSCYRVLMISELARRICDLSDKSTWVNLLYLSRRTFACMAPIVWEDVDLKSMFLLIPEVEFSKRNENEQEPEKLECVFSFPKILDLTRFKLYAGLVKVARAHVPYILRFDGQDLSAALQRPPLPNLQRLVLNTYGAADATTFRWVSSLLTPSLQGFEFRSIYLEASGGEDTRCEHSWIEHEEYLELIGQISRECPHLETLRIFPGAHSTSSGTAVNSINYYGITSLKHLRTLALGVTEIAQELFLALGQLPCLETLSLHDDRPGLRETKDDRMDIPDNSFLALRHLALYGLSDSSMQVICTVPSLFRHLVKASFIFIEHDFLGISKQHDFSFTLLQCLDHSPHLVDLTVFTLEHDACLVLYSPAILDIFRHIPLRRLRLGKARLKSWGDIDEVDSDDSSVDERTGHVEIQWRDFFVTVPYLEELHLDLQLLMSHHLATFASALPNLQLLTLLGILFVDEQASVDRPATQPITIQCLIYANSQDPDQHKVADASRVARYIHGIWPNAQFKLKKSMSWVYGDDEDDEAMNEAVEMVAGINEAIELLGSSGDYRT